MSEAYKPTEEEKKEAESNLSKQERDLSAQRKAWFDALFVEGRKDVGEEAREKVMQLLKECNLKIISDSTIQGDIRGHSINIDSERGVGIIDGVYISEIKVRALFNAYKDIAQFQMSGSSSRISPEFELQLANGMVDELVEAANDVFANLI